MNGKVDDSSDVNSGEINPDTPPADDSAQLPTTVLFTIPRVTGWLAHYNEMLEQDSRITRPRQLYVGADVRDYVPMAGR